MKMQREFLISSLDSYHNWFYIEFKMLVNDICFFNFFFCVCVVIKVCCIVTQHANILHFLDIHHILMQTIFFSCWFSLFAADFFCVIFFFRICLCNTFYDSIYIFFCDERKLKTHYVYHYKNFGACNKLIFLRVGMLI